ncbi:type II secretion system F family protein [Stieleria sp. JC731]|uniref:type II secretion system F family protein n=1 Tax=Pirellulaceae TaxID=2691357 RepID=UPI001E33DA12|nr:type II secretion system F family protein [Stieleria sp. JC731]MCC9601695.1 type II secretion system F family protein [Stieleria sp. JC731]
MLPIIVSAFSFCAVAGGVMLIGTYFSRHRLRAEMLTERRLRELDGSTEQANILSIFKQSSLQSDEQRTTKKRILQAIDRLIDNSEIGCSIKTFLWGSIFLGLAVGAGLYFVISWVAIPLGLASVFAPMALLIMMQRSRNRKLVEQLPGVFQSISRAVRSGKTVNSAMRNIADRFPKPICKEFALCCEQQDRGLTKELAFRKLGERSGVMDMQIFVVALLVQSKSGGDLPDLLQNLASTMEKRGRLKQRVRTLTSEGRMQAVVLLMLPVAAFVALQFIAPDYVETLLTKKELLFMTAGLQCLGFFWIYRIINFRF